MGKSVVQTLDNAFISKVYGLTGLGLLLAALSSVLFAQMQVPIAAVILSAIAGLALVIGVCLTTGTLSACLFLGVAALEGPVLGPVLSRMAHVAPGAIEISLVLTAIVFGGLTAYVFQTKKDFSFMGGALFMALLVLVVASIAAIFLPALQVLVSAAGIVIFSLYVLYDTSNIIHGRYNSDQYASAALALYLDVLNLFLDILRIVAAFSTSSD